MKFEVNDTIINYLISKDSVFEFLFEKFGYLSLELDDDIFDAIVSQIVGQMLSINVKKKMLDNIHLMVGNITPENIVKYTVDDYRKCGISSRKGLYIIEMAKDILDGKLSFDGLETLSDDMLIAELIKIKGVGKWTAEMIALFSYGRENIFSFSDVALKNGIIKAKGFKSLSEKRFIGLKKKYTPYASYAALYFYRYNDFNE